MRKIWMLSFAVLLGCDGAVKNYVTGVTPPNGRAPAATTPSAGPVRLKVSPGHISSAGPSTLAMRATATPTQRLLKSTNISAELTLHRQSESP